MTVPSRLLLVTTSMARGGAERQVVDLAVAFRRRGWKVAVLSMIPPTDHMTELADAGVEVLDLGMARGRPTLGALIRYRSLVRGWHPDVIHGHMIHANLLTRLGRLLVPRVPIVNTVHNVIEGARWREIAYRLTDRLATTTTAVSQAAVERYVRVGAAPAHRIRYIPNGIDLSRAVVPVGTRTLIRDELGVVGREFLWVTVGRLDPEKGHDLLLLAFETVRRAHPEARLAIVGGAGTERATLERLVVDLELKGSAVLLGLRTDVAALLSAADAFVLSSRWEGLPIVLLEAAAQSLPIVSTDVGGCREVADPRLGAVLTGPDAAGLAVGMSTIMELTGAERAAIGARLRDHVESSFDLDAVATRWEQVYRSVART